MENIISSIFLDQSSVEILRSLIGKELELIQFGHNFLHDNGYKDLTDVFQNPVIKIKCLDNSEINFYNTLVLKTGGFNYHCWHNLEVNNKFIEIEKPFSKYLPKFIVSKIEIFSSGFGLRSTRNDNYPDLNKYVEYKYKIKGNFYFYLQSDQLILIKDRQNNIILLKCSEAADLSIASTTNPITINKILYQFNQFEIPIFSKRLELI
jgi:hypothetical protein